MEEKETKQASKPTYEQLEQYALQMQQRLVMTEDRLNAIDFASMRLTWLFRVIENNSKFSEYFVNKCSDEIQKLLTLEEQEKEPD